MNNLENPVTQFVEQVMPHAPSFDKREAEVNLRSYLKVAEKMFKRRESERRGPLTNPKPLD